MNANERRAGDSRTSGTLRMILGLWMAFSPAVGAGSEILLRLSGRTDFPGIMAMQAGEKHLDRLCILGRGAKGNVDLQFLEDLSKKGVPKGGYQIAEAFPEEQWPSPSFSGRADALRFIPVDQEATVELSALGKKGFAVHGRDFFPLAARLTQNPKMIRFFSDELFEQLAATWGVLRLSNWDMARIFDFYSRVNPSHDPWPVRVAVGDPEDIKKICEPLKVQRKPGVPPE